MKNALLSILTFASSLLVPNHAFTTPNTQNTHAFQYHSTSTTSTSSSLKMVDANDLFRASKAARQAGADDRVVELRRPLGVVLEEDDQGNVYVEAIAPKGNAARTGQVQVGDVVTMCSATFGDQMWSCRGAGLTRVLAAIRVRAGPSVKLVFESSNETTQKAKKSTKAAKAAEEARLRALAQKEKLLEELERDEKKLRKGKFLGLF
mmetsp:Transcript_188/g.286  ORF Transcript_188/g.286 Transcript_188/m.286 type:complete len:206 (-) Transcript_188:425-1042(-)|eukprot:CAMPEP_0184870812 /NCGR_PEP_ID=MMETSP0580-20130426/38868_1 /TAXON_ID=1118495 /ORGANISM="Dactyliosolen fragilissimus" /LENGTH=205 /DNA_ID=CAMNT_0027373113 /DNA_START=32 /DNA_END=649 /DNA_ORIENTATION=+